ncbi:hypothetical protein ACFW16_22480 [Inquilinus sp. NPDC058860]
MRVGGIELPPVDRRRGRTPDASKKAQPPTVIELRQDTSVLP